MGKPKKNQSKNNPDIRSIVIEDLGKEILYIGLGEKRMSCKQCGKTKKKGMFRLFKDVMFCSKDCVKMSKR